MSRARLGVLAHDGYRLVALRRVAGSLCILGLLAAAPAQAGGISGTVRGPGGVPLSGFGVAAYSASVDPLGSGATTGFNGGYLIEGLAAGNYFVQVQPPFPNPQGYTGATYAGIASNSLCGARGTEVAVGGGTTAGIDFEIAVGATIGGTVTQADTGSPSTFSIVFAYDHRGCLAGGVGVDATGAYELEALPPGQYYLVTFSGGERADLLYPSVPCLSRQCDVLQGTPVSTGSTADFVLAAGGSIAGTITHTGANPFLGAEVQIWKGSEKVATVFTMPSGQYIVTALSVGNGYRVLAKAPGLVAEVYPNAPCPNGGCNVGGTGTAIDVPTPGAVVTGKDIQLAPGHSIGGTVAPTSQSGIVQVFGSTGPAGEVSSVGSYTVPDLPDGNYVVRATMGGRLTELYDNRPCPANQICLGDPVAVSGANRTGINFTLALAHAIGGTVRSETGDPIGGVAVEVLSSDGSLMSTGWTALDGTYLSATEGLPAGTYFVRTRLPRRLHQFVDRLWNDRPCGAGCIPAAGDPVAVTASADTLGIDFALPFSGLDFYTLPPCRVFDSRSGSTIASGVLVALRLEGTCGIPGNAVVVSANVTVISASAGGHLALWPSNLPNQPPTSTVNFAAGATRANNAMLAMSLEGVVNVAARGVLPGGRYHLVVDVNGYFAGTTPP